MSKCEFWNVLFVGDAKVGKTALIKAKLRDGFDGCYIPTVYDTHVIKLNNKQQQDLNGVDQLLVWDTAGHEDFDYLREITAYRPAKPLHAVVLCFAVDDQKSLENLSTKWIPELKSKTDFPNIPTTILLGTKCDQRRGDEDTTQTLTESSLCPVVSFKECEQFAEDIGLLPSYLECSAKTGQGVNEVFDIIASNIQRSLFARRYNRKSFRQRTLAKTQLLLTRLSNNLAPVHEEESNNAVEIQDVSALNEEVDEHKKIKVAFIGDDQSGKRTLAISFGPTLQVDGPDGPETLDLAVGVLPSSCTCSNGENCTDYLPMLLSFYCGHDTDVIVICSAVDQPDSVQRIKTYWLPDICRQMSKTTLPMLVVGTKLDLRENNDGNNALTSPSDAKQTAQEIGAIDYLECSAKTGEGLEEVREAICRVYISNKKQKLEKIATSENQPLRRVKCILAGDQFCGKSKLVDTFLKKKEESEDSSENHSSFEQFNSTMKIEGKNGQTTLFELEICKTSCTCDENGSVQGQVYSNPNSDAILLCFSVDQASSLERISTFWKENISLYRPNVPVILVATKTDLRRAKGSNLLTREQGKRVAREIGAFEYVECSAKTSPESVRRVFEAALNAVVESRPSSPSSQRKRNQRNSLRKKQKKIRQRNCKQM